MQKTEKRIFGMMKAFVSSEDYPSDGNMACNLYCN
ncbi:unnamed protein product [Larinioides sclopetarius]|uniref:Uncharacterized protein n=1 Tax=Larinioides sclopetarius TaxID=280406 RepID=A0AAV1ZWV5_9ARAC